MKSWDEIYYKLHKRLSDNSEVINNGLKNSLFILLPILLFKFFTIKMNTVGFISSTANLMHEIIGWTLLYLTIYVIGPYLLVVIDLISNFIKLSRKDR